VHPLKTIFVASRKWSPSDPGQSERLADFLPTVTIAAKNLAADITNHNVKENDLQGEPAITSEHVQNNTSVRSMLGDRGIKPEALPPEEDLKKLERRVKSSEKKMIKGSGLPQKFRSGDGE
jgi:DNA-damage-inducible protein D